MATKAQSIVNIIPKKVSTLLARSLQAKITAIIVLVVLITLFLGATLILMDDASQFKKDFSNKMLLITKTVGNYSATDIAFNDLGAAKDSLSKLEQIPGILQAHLYDENGILFVSLKQEKEKTLHELPKDNATIEFHDDFLRTVNAINFNNKHHGYIELFASTEELSNKIKQRLTVLAFMTLVLTLIAYFLARWLQRMISKPVLSLAETARNIADNKNYNLRVTKTDSDEIGLLYDSFNHMLDKIVEEQTRTQQMLGKLTDSEARFSAMFNSIPDAVMFADTEREIKLNNPAVFEMFQYSDHELIGNTTEMLYPTHEAYLEQGEIRFNKDAKSKSLPYEVQYQRKDGNVFWTESLGAKVLTPDNKHIGFIGIFRDITKRKKNEEELFQHRNNLEKLVTDRTQKLETLNEELKAFSYSISHDLRAPLRSINGFSQMLVEDYSSELDETAQDYLARIRNATDSMGKLIDDMLALSHITSSELNLVEVNLSEIAENIVDRLQDGQPDRKTKIEIKPGLKVHGDEGMLEILLNNIIGNSWKYSSKKELIEIQFYSERSDGKTIFCVKDKGDGFDMNYSDKLFLPFHRLHKKNQFSGTGVGLAIVQRVINKHGGKIWAESKKYEGSAFYFHFPE